MEGMRALLRGSLGKSLSTLGQLDRLAAAWPVACGAAMAAHGEVLAFADGVLTIRVADAVWLDQMRAMRLRLTGELARIAAVPLREIHFEGANDRASTPARVAPETSDRRAKASVEPAGKPLRNVRRSPRSRG